MMNHDASRNCVRCGKDLTDAASMEVGIGPICRKLDNAVLAQTFDAKPADALLHILTVKPESLATETQPTFLKMREALMTEDTSDYRTSIKRMEWMLSFPQTRDAAFNAFCNTAHALGYHGIVALWQGDASKSMATVTYLAGRIHVAGPKNPTFRVEVKKLGGFFHPAVGDAKPTWSVAASKAQDIAKLIKTYYPLNEGLTDALKLAAAAPAALMGPNMAQKPKPQVHVLLVNDKYKVFTPFNKEFVDAIKYEVPAKSRSWSPTEKCWEVEKTYLNTLKALLAKHYFVHIDPENEGAANAPVANTATNISTANPASLPF